jgi:hypothetical protein
MSELHSAPRFAKMAATLRFLNGGPAWVVTLLASFLKKLPQSLCLYALAPFVAPNRVLQLTGGPEADPASLKRQSKLDGAAAGSDVLS